MEYKELKKGEGSYPDKLISRMGDKAPERIYYQGDLTLLNRFSLASYAADSISGEAMMAANDLLFTIREYEMNFIGGWLSVMETEIFRLGLFRDNLTVTCFSSRRLGKDNYERYLLDRFYPPLHEFPEREEFFRRADERELLFISVIKPDETRNRFYHNLKHNWIGVNLADAVFIPYADESSKTSKLAQKILSTGIPVFTSDCEDNAHLKKMGVPVFNRKSLKGYLDEIYKPPIQKEKIKPPEIQSVTYPKIKHTARYSQLSLLEETGPYQSVKFKKSKRKE